MRKLWIALTVVVLACLVGMMWQSEIEGADPPVSDDQDPSTSCGDDLIWKFEDGTLSISGTGAMDSFGSTPPWKGLSIQELVLNEGITSISSKAFMNLTGIESISVPSTVRSIGSQAFYGCTNVKTVYFYADSCSDFSNNSNVFGNLGNNTSGASFYFYGADIPSYVVNGANVTHISIGSVSSIGAFAFYNCKATFNTDGWTDTRTIGQSAFYGCTGLGEIVICSGVTSIGQNAFYGCSNVKAIEYLARTCGDFTASPFGNLGVKGDVNITIGSNVTKIPAYLFHNLGSNFKIQTLPQSVQTIGKYAFANSSIALPDINISSLRTIGESAFSGSKVQNVTISNQVTDIGSSAFYNCTNLSHVVFNAASFKDLDSSKTIFSTGSGNASFEIGENVKKVPAYLLYGASVFSKVTGCANVTTIGDSAFERCTADFDVNLQNCTTIGEAAFRDSGLVEITIPQGVKSIGAGAFDCNGLSYVAFNAENCRDVIGMTSVFSTTAGDATMNIGPDVERIPAYLLYGVAAFSKIEGGSGVTSVGAYAFQDCDAEIVFSSTVCKEFGEGAFKNSGLTSIYLGPSTTNFAADSFENCYNVSKIEYNSTTLSRMFSATSSPLSTAGSEASPVTVTIGTLVRTVPDYLVYNNEHVTAIELGTAEEIGVQSFSGTGVKKVVFPETLESIGERAFSDTYGLTSISFESFYTQIGKSAFHVDGSNRELHIECFRKAVQNDYDWRGDNREPDYTWIHLQGEYDGMMEVLFTVVSPVLGADLTNAIFDFFIDNVSLRAIESIDLGSQESNFALLGTIAIFLTAILFILLYSDRNEFIRIMEIILSFLGVFIVLFSSVRRLWEVEENLTIVAIVTIIFLLGLYYPLRAAYTQIRDRPAPRDGETLIRIFTLDREAFLGAAFYPWKLMLRDLRHPGGLFRFILAICCSIFGVVLSAVFSICFVVFHIPAFVISFILANTFRKMDENCRKHTIECVCPLCGERIIPSYRCSECGNVHARLAPGQFGINWSKCGYVDPGTDSICGHRMHCRAVDKRWEMSQAVCPRCGKDIEIAEAEPFSISLIGASGCGKTSLMTSAFEQLIDVGHRNDMDIATYGGSANVQSAISEFNRKNLRNGDAPTAPYTVIFAPKGKNRDFITHKAIQIFDSDGDMYSSQSERRNQNQFRFNEGFVVVINPYDLQQFASTRGIRSDYRNDPTQVLSVFENLHSEATDIGPSDKVETPLAIVITHTSEACLPPSNSANVYAPGDGEAVRAFLMDNGALNFINSVEFRFQKIHYFACDAIPKDDHSDSFAPIFWISIETNRRVERYLR